MHIDSYKIFSYDTTWKNGKESKDTEVKQMLTSKKCIQGREFMRLLEELDNTWHGDYCGFDCEIEVTFKPAKR